MLVFLSGEREIRDTADALRRRDLRHTEVLPLYARLSTAEQHRVFAAAHRPADRAGHQRRRDLAHRARHPLRDRPRHGPHLPLQPAAQGAAAADRADLAGVGQPAQGPLRPASRRHLHPALLRGRLRRPAGVHRPGDPAHQPRLGHPADDRARPRRHRRRSRSSTRPTGAASPTASRCCSELGALRRATRLTAARPAAGRAAGRPAAGPDGARGRAATAACARCWSSRRRCRSRTRGSGRWTDQQAADEARPLRRPDSDFLAFLNLWDYLREQQRELSASQFRRLCRPSSSTTCGSASGRTCTASCARSSSRREMPSASARARAAGAHGSGRPPGSDRMPPRPARRPAVAHRAAATSRSRSTSAPAARGSRSSRARRCSEDARAG